MKFTTSVKQNYSLLWNTMIVNPKHKEEVEKLIAQAKKNHVRYEALANVMKVKFPESKIPPQFIACVHYMECGFLFTRHLHNGDKLTARTFQVPSGRPKTGKPPFTFEESALDALTYQELHLEKDWSIENMLYKLEAYNGYGYRDKGINSPYLWSFSNHYTKGKYVADHVYDKNAVSTQCGSALILRGII